MTAATYVDHQHVSSTTEDVVRVAPIGLRKTSGGGYCLDIAVVGATNGSKVVATFISNHARREPAHWIRIRTIHGGVVSTSGEARGADRQPYLIAEARPDSSIVLIVPIYISGIVSGLSDEEFEAAIIDNQSLKSVETAIDADVLIDTTPVRLPVQYVNLVSSTE